MLITKLKSEEEIASLASGKVFIINCHGCKEVGFPEEEAKALQKKLAEEGKVVGINRGQHTASVKLAPDNIIQVEWDEIVDASQADNV